MPSPGGISLLFHALLAGWVGLMLVMGSVAPDRYRALLQEDRIVEWTTVWLFLAAAFVGLRGALTHRRVFDGLVALFCLFVAGEEISWGQRLPGILLTRVFPGEQFSAGSLAP